jgi:CheY-like chemotaxis protein
MTSEKKTILVVEDDASMRRALKAKLTHEGFDVVEAVNGEEGLSLALSGHPDLILLDILMPKMTGEEMLRELRKDEWGGNVPVILLTNVTFLQDRDTPDRTSEYLLKSNTELSELIEKIRVHLG